MPTGVANWEENVSMTVLLIFKITYLMSQLWLEKNINNHFCSLFYPKQISNIILSFQNYNTDIIQMAHLMGSILNKPPRRSLLLSKGRKNNLSQVKWEKLELLFWQNDIHLIRQWCQVMDIQWYFSPELEYKGNEDWLWALNHAMNMKWSELRMQICF